MKFTGKLSEWAGKWLYDGRNSAPIFIVNVRRIKGQKVEATYVNYHEREGMSWADGFVRAQGTTWYFGRYPEGAPPSLRRIMKASFVERKH